MPIISILCKLEVFWFFQQQEKISKGFYMPLWTWDELVKLWRECYSHRSADDVAFLYIRWGGVVRWVLEHANEPENLDKLSMAVNSMNAEELKKACRGDSDDRVYMLQVLLTRIGRHATSVMP